MAFFFTKSMLGKMNKAKYSVGTESGIRKKAEEESGINDDPWKKVYENSKKGVRLAKDMICRVCARSGCNPLNEKLEGFGYDIKTAISSITNVTINADDSLPKYICTDCLESLKSAMCFKRTCEVADRRYKRILNPYGDPFLHSYPYSKHDFQLILHKINEKRKQCEEQKEYQRKKRERIQQKKNSQTKTDSYKCSPCDLTFTSKEKLIQHRRERQCMRRACEICGQLVVSVPQHMRLIHKQTVPHRCDTCGKQFPVLTRLKSHMLTHTNTFKFFCDLCPYKCKHKYYLVMHMRTHTGEKPYKCTDCPATFVNPSNLNKHKLTHQEKQFKCVLCDKAFRTRWSLREHHEAAHMNIKHTCHYCGRDFCYKSDLRKHEIRNHNRTKRDYAGGEPSYKQAERMQNEGEEVKWRVEAQSQQPQQPQPQPPQPPAVPQGALVQATYIDQSHLQPIYFSDVAAIIQQQGQSLVPQQTVQISLPDLSMKKGEETKTYETQQVIGYF